MPIQWFHSSSSADCMLSRQAHRSLLRSARSTPDSHWIVHSLQKDLNTLLARGLRKEFQSKRRTPRRFFLSHGPLNAGRTSIEFGNRNAL